MSDLEKGSAAYRNNNVHHHATDGSAASALPLQTFVHNTAPQLRILGNPGPLGLYSFASTTFILSMFNVGARDVAVPNVVVGMALGVGGLAQLLAGMWEFACGNTFGATAFSSYGGFWLSYAALLIPGTGIAAAYADTPTEEPNAIGIFLASWFIITFLFFLGSLRISYGLVALFFFLDITFLLLMIAEFTGTVAIAKAGGGFGILTAAIAYYCGTAQLLTPENSLFTLPIGVIKKRAD
jgi:succinate-acetate transporter protein